MEFSFNGKNEWVMVKMNGFGGVWIWW